MENLYKFFLKNKFGEWFVEELDEIIREYGVKSEAVYELAYNWVKKLGVSNPYIILKYVKGYLKGNFGKREKI